MTPENLHAAFAYSDDEDIWGAELVFRNGDRIEQIGSLELPSAEFAMKWLEDKVSSLKRMTEDSLAVGSDWISLTEDGIPVLSDRFARYLQEQWESKQRDNNASSVETAADGRPQSIQQQAAE